MADALALTAHGIELADAIHLSSRPPGVGLCFFRSIVCSPSQPCGCDPRLDSGHRAQRLTAGDRAYQ